MENRKEYYPCLDGFRAIAILLVLLHHLNYFFKLKPSVDSPLSFVWFRVGQIGLIGVDIFFVISGFLIAGLLWQDLESTGTVRLQRFYARRALKILPQYAVVVLVGIIFTVLVFQSKYTLSSYVSYFLFLQNYVPPLRFLEHLWSIAIEEHFYFLLPLLFVGICRIWKDANQRSNILIVSFICLITAGNWLRYYAFAGMSVEEMNDPTFRQVTHVRFDALMFGCLLRFIFPHVQRRYVQHRSNVLPIIFFLIGGLIFASFLGEFVPIRWWDYTLVYIGTGGLMLAALLGYAPLKMIVENKFLMVLGRKSYGIYLWHYVLLYFFVQVYFSTGMTWLIPLYVITALGIGSLTTNTIEKKFLDLRKKIVP